MTSGEAAAPRSRPSIRTIPAASISAPAARVLCSRSADPRTVRSSSGTARSERTCPSSSTDAKPTARTLRSMSRSVPSKARSASSRSTSVVELRDRTDAVPRRRSAPADRPSPVGSSVKSRPLISTARSSSGSFHDRPRASTRTLPSARRGGAPPASAVASSSSSSSFVPAAGSVPSAPGRSVTRGRISSISSMRTPLHSDDQARFSRARSIRANGGRDPAATTISWRSISRVSRL